MSIIHCHASLFNIIDPVVPHPFVGRALRAARPAVLEAEVFRAEEEVERPSRHEAVRSDAVQEDRAVQRAAHCPAVSPLAAVRFVVAVQQEAAHSVAVSPLAAFGTVVLAVPPEAARAYSGSPELSRADCSGNFHAAVQWRAVR